MTPRQLTHLNALLATQRAMQLFGYAMERVQLGLFSGAADDFVAAEGEADWAMETMGMGEERSAAE